MPCETDPSRWKALAVAALAFVMTLIDVSIVNVALPSIGQALEFAEADLQWVVTAYAITFGGFVLLGGRAADIFGRRRVFMTGVALFTLASLVCGLARSESVLIASRAVQGLGAATIASAALSIVMATFAEGTDRNRALGIWAALAGSGAAIGVLAGGVLTEYVGWEWIFLVNVPIGVIVLVFARRFIRESRSEREPSNDLAGAVTVTAGLALLVYAVSNAPDRSWGDVRTTLLIAFAALILAAFVVIESRAQDPLVPFGIFRVGQVAGANVAMFLVGAVIPATFFLLTLYVQRVLGWSALTAGLTFIAIAGTAILWAGLAQALVTHVGPRPVMAGGFTALTAGMVWYTQIPVDASYWSDLLPGYLLIGFAMPFAFVPVSVAALAGVRQHEAGLASGLLNTSNQIGGAIGVAVASSVCFWRFDTSMIDNGPGSFAESFTSGIHLAFWMLAGVALTGVVMAFALLRAGERREARQAATEEPPYVSVP
jgi:EmrB/QacA subfamily drug resistance transporter